MSDEKKKAEKAKEREALEKAFDPRQYEKGTMALVKPIHEGDTEIQELKWDFNALSGEEFCDALDRDVKGNNVFRLTNRQALLLFAAAAAKETEKLDAKDIMDRIGIQDAQKATQIATLFFNTSSRSGGDRISFM